METHTLMIGFAALVLCACTARPQNNTTETKPINKIELGKNFEIVGGISNKDYELSIAISTEPKVGGSLVTKIILTPAPGLHVNQEYPHKVSLSALPAGVECAKTELTKEDAKKVTEERAEFEVSCTSKDGGSKEFQAEYRLSVCTDNYCATPKEKLAWKFDVK